MKLVLRILFSFKINSIRIISLAFRIFTTIPCCNPKGKSQAFYRIKNQQLLRKSICFILLSKK